MENNETKSKCENCEYARKALSEGYVGCVKFDNKNNVGDYQGIMEAMELRRISTGWVNLRKWPESNEIGQGDDGLVTNNVVVYEKEYCCKHHEKRQEF